jgi:hypothetical protein
MRQNLLFYNLNSIFMKKLYLFAALAAMLAACSENDLTVNEQPSKATETVEDAVNFDVYVGRGMTRAGANGVIITDSLKQVEGTDPSYPHGKAGFGVFGYYTDGESYSGITKPNFFYNQQVKWDKDNSLWKYSPIKYWPNEFGSDAISDQVDRLTFFAYAPWVDVNPSTGQVKDDKTPNYATTNITAMTRNNVTGDPFIKYTSTMDATNAVDLLWGVAAEDFVSSNSAVNQNDIKKGKPYIDVVKPGIDANSKIKFDFKHALARLFVDVNAVVNTAVQPGIDLDNKYTRIWVRSVTFEGITLSGALNLNSDAANGPEWYDTNGNNKITTGSLTVYDGRKDGKEAMLTATNETPASLNDALVQTKAYELNTSGEIKSTFDAGVTKTATNLFKNNATNNTVFAIPTGEKMKVTIVYDVETVDPSLAFYLSDGKTLGSTVENSITKTIDAFGEIKAGYCYTLHLHLGMRTVDFDASVTEWQNIGANVDLPSNLQTFAVSSEGTHEKVYLAKDATTYQFAISGLEPNQVIDPVNTITGITVTRHPADASGVAIIDLAIDEANTTTKIKEYGERTFKAGSKKVHISFNQAAAPIGFTTLNFIDQPDGTNDRLAIGCTATDTNQPNAFAALVASGKGYIKVYQNGVEITAGCTFGSTGGTIILPCEAVNGDIFTVLLKANDAPEESKTVTATVPAP